VAGVLVFMASQSSSSTGFDLVSVSISKSGKYLPESRFNGATIAMVLLTKAHDFFGERTKPDRTRAKILGQFGSGSNFGLSSLVECDRIASSTNFLALQNTVDSI
jgi:hypothetical protein